VHARSAVRRPRPGVRCTGRGLFLIGPGMEQVQLAELHITEGLANVALRETYLTARERAGRRAGQ
jgi:hypothetical protein